MVKATPSDTVQVGIIGARIGQAHAKGYAKVPQAKVVAVCDLDEARARQLTRDNGMEDAQIFTDYRAMLDAVPLDAVSVCLPNVLHRPVAVDCLEAGLHILCEKPLALNAAQGQEIADAAAKNQRQCMIGQVLRFRPASLVLKQAIENGDLGRVYYCHTGWLRQHGIPGYGGWFTTKALSGGGPLIDIGVHLLDLAWWLCGCPQPVTVSGSAYAEFGPRGKGLGPGGAIARDGTFDVEDLAVALIRFANGLTINLEVSWAIHNERQRQWCQLFGHEGGCDWGEHAALYKDVNGVATNTPLELPPGDAWHGQIAHFIDCVLHGTTPDPDVTQGVTMMKMLDAVYQSAATGREVVIQ